MQLFMRFVTRFVGSIPNRPLNFTLSALWVLSSSVGLSISAAGEAYAGTCYTPVYYEMMFKAQPQVQLSAGDPRLAASSDFLAATGIDHCGEKGCMEGVNYGQWDQVFMNSALNDPQRVPATFRLLGLNISLFDKKNNPMGTAFTIDRERLRLCFDTPLPIGGYQPFNAAGGHSDHPDVLEPGESIVSCVCSMPADRGKSGYAKVEVAYQPVVWMDQLASETAAPAGSSGTTGNRIVRWKGTTQVRGLGKGRAAYFLFTPPPAASHPVTDLRISLINNSHIELYTRRIRRGWSWNQAEWSMGRLTSPLVKAGDEYWLLVRSQADGGSTDVEVTYTTQGSSEPGQRAPAGFRPVGPDNTAKSAFKAFVLGLGTTPAPLSAGVVPKQSLCCTGSAE